jgi:hypothetical protein
MAYFVHYDPDEDKVSALPISDAAKQAVRDFIRYAIAEVEDSFRLDPANRPEGTGPYFERELILVDAEGDNHFHHIKFLVNDSAAPAGVLIIVEVQHHRADEWRPASSFRNGAVQ